MGECWWINIDPYEGRPYKRKKGTMTDIHNNKHNFSVRLCKKCSRVFESVYANGVGTGLYFYEDFPTYGLFRTICPECNSDG